VKPYWLSWWMVPENGEFELHSPWWISGSRGSDDAASICAAVRAESEEAAKGIVVAAHDLPPPLGIEWRFCEEMPEHWTPFRDRFLRAAWMQW
jgi:hypothetical protein